MVATAESPALSKSKIGLLGSLPWYQKWYQGLHFTPHQECKLVACIDDVAKESECGFR